MTEREPLISVKTVGRLLRSFDEKVIDGFFNRTLISWFAALSKRVRETLHAGHLRNYTLVTFVALLLLTLVALFLRK